MDRKEESAAVGDVVKEELKPVQAVPRKSSNREKRSNKKLDEDLDRRDVNPIIAWLTMRTTELPSIVLGFQEMMLGQQAKAV